MKKYENRNFRVSACEIIGIVIFSFLLVVTAYFYKSYRDVKKLFNIEKTEVDYIIQAPSEEQVAEIGNLRYIDKIVPYYYRSVDISTEKGRIGSTLFIIENESDIEYTTFSKSLLVKAELKKGENNLFVTDDFAKTAGAAIGDPLQISIDGTNVTFIIAGIYKSDYRHVGGSLLTVMSDEIKENLISKRYGGAFVASNNLFESDSYFNNDYTPRGDVRTRDEFASEGSYQTYLETREQSDTTKEAFITADYIKELSRRNSGKQKRNISISILLILLGYVIMFLIITVRTKKYTSKNVLRDIKDNFTIDQEVRMYRKYLFDCAIFMMIANVVIGIVSHLLGWMPTTFIIGELCATIVVVFVISNISINKLRQRFLIENKKI